jgi:hypothetical protein
MATSEPLILIHVNILGPNNIQIGTWLQQMKWVFSIDEGLICY